MTNLHIVLKLIHILGAMVLFGTGLGIAFFMVMAHRTRDAALIAHTARTVVIADAVFTATAVIVQPVSGAALVWLLGYSWREPWIVASLALYLLAGLCWLPVVWIQIKLRNFAADAARRGEPPSAEYRKLFRIWFCLGWPAFLAVIAILILMIAKPSKTPPPIASVRAALLLISTDNLRQTILGGIICVTFSSRPPSAPVFSRALLRPKT